MPWSLPAVSHEVFPRNPLESVVVELRYAPILKVSASVDELQDRLRVRFPEVADRQEITFMWSADHTPTIVQRATRSFARSKDASEAIVGDHSASVTCRRHEHRETLQTDFRAVVDALVGVVGHVVPLRLGLRYVNRIRPDMAPNLPPHEAFTALLAPSVTFPLRGYNPDGQTRFLAEVDDAMDRGRLTVRQAREPVDGQGMTHRVDLDRYVDTPALDEVHALLADFGDDIWRAFQLFAGPALHAWMREAG
jgi:uncharacterized protein (TIGR04255 family)